MSRLSPINGTRLMRVQYDSAIVRELAIGYYRRILELTHSMAPPRTQRGWRAVSQWLMETVFLAFFTKRASWTWEQELRLVARNILVKQPIHEHPRRLELELEPGALKAIVLSPSSPPTFEAELGDLAATHWPGELIDVRRAVKAG